jgi:hypothetical protein
VRVLLALTVILLGSCPHKHPSAASLKSLIAFQIRLLVQGHINCNPYAPYCGADAFFEGLMSVATILCTSYFFPRKNTSVYYHIFSAGLFTAYIVFSNARSRIHPLIAELPYAVEDENGERRPAGDWADADIAEGIPDDSPEPEGEVRL